MLCFEQEGDAKYIFQGVHEQIQYTTAKEPWGADEPRVSKVVLIGRNIDRDEMMASFKACMVDAPTKPTGATQPRKAKSWYEMAAEGVLF